MAEIGDYIIMHPLGLRASDIIRAYAEGRVTINEFRDEWSAIYLDTLAKGTRETVEETIANALAGNGPEF